MKIVFATNNINKLSEIKSLVPGEVEILSLQEINCFEELPEEQDTLLGNSLQKAHYVFNKYGLNCFADDTGLEINSLNGEPGVYSARYAGNHCSSEDNIQKVLEKLLGSNNREASFKTVIALIINGKEYFFRGQIQGTITVAKRGLGGFGYDPIFLPLNSKDTFAEMNSLEKGKISHRGEAIKKLVRFLALQQLIN
ncbi:MAG: RdgB/HAM1 family non-canonical purine NTP pyrophosphatase [Bacteroidota bacterium]|nr:RdgB/HAM1 family non-canonical purine NTP pyrophosphatase [Bacteroidota bacterium]